MTKTEDLSKGEIIIYKSCGQSNLEVIQQDNTLWLSAEKIAKLFGKERSNIQRHIAKIYKEQELEENSTCAFFAQVQQEGTRTVSRKIPYYNLDIILAVGYRVTSKTATEFRKWAASCFLYFMDKNNILYQNGTPIIDSAALFALTLLIAESNPNEMETIKTVVLSVLNRGGAYA